jgi:hypothetical protein
MDVAENGITAGARRICILIEEDLAENRLKIVIKDNGKGISSDMLSKVTDPFVTSRTTRRVGLGLSLLKEAATRCDGDFMIESEPGKGTVVTATFRHDHIDRAPLGDIAGTIAVLIAGNPDVDFVYDHVIDGKSFSFDTGKLRMELGKSPADPNVLFHLRKQIEGELEKLVTNRG